MSKNVIYQKAKRFMLKYPFTVAFRIRKHAKVASQFVGEDEEIKYVFVAQKNFGSFDFVNTNIIVLTDKRLIVATKRLVFGYFFRMITPDMFNDLTIKKGLIFGSVLIDTVKERIALSNIDPSALPELETIVSEYMMEEKRKFINESNS